MGLVELEYDFLFLFVKKYFNFFKLNQGSRYNLIRVDIESIDT